MMFSDSTLCLMLLAEGAASVQVTKIYLYLFYRNLDSAGSSYVYVTVYAPMLRFGSPNTRALFVGGRRQVL